MIQNFHFLAVHAVQCTSFTLYWILYTVQHNLYFVLLHCTVQSLRWFVSCTVYSRTFTVDWLCSVKCTTRTLNCIFVCKNIFTYIYGEYRLQFLNYRNILHQSLGGSCQSTVKYSFPSSQELLSLQLSTLFLLVTH